MEHGLLVLLAHVRWTAGEPYEVVVDVRLFGLREAEDGEFLRSAHGGGAVAAFDGAARGKFVAGPPGAGGELPRGCVGTHGLLLVQRWAVLVGDNRVSAFGPRSTLRPLVWAGDLAAGFLPCALWIVRELPSCQNLNRT